MHHETWLPSHRSTLLPAVRCRHYLFISHQVFELSNFIQIQTLIYVPSQNISNNPQLLVSYKPSVKSNILALIQVSHLDCSTIPALPKYYSSGDKSRIQLSYLMLSSLER